MAPANFNVLPQIRYKMGPDTLSFAEFDKRSMKLNPQKMLINVSIIWTILSIHYIWCLQPCYKNLRDFDAFELAKTVF